MTTEPETIAPEEPEMIAPDATTKTGESTFLHIAQFNEFGSWARHYSVVRMTLGTFWLALPLAVLQSQWKSPRDMYTFWVVLGMCVFGVLLYWLFTKKTYSALDKQRTMTNSARKAVGLEALPEVGSYWRNFDGMPIGAIAYLLVALADLQYLLKS